jgi:hypothetical protein
VLAVWQEGCVFQKKHLFGVFIRAVRHATNKFHIEMIDAVQITGA